MRWTKQSADPSVAGKDLWRGAEMGHERHCNRA